MFTASVAAVASATFSTLLPFASKPLAVTLPANTGASANWISTVLPVITVLMLLFEPAPVKPPVMFSVSPSLRSTVPLLPAKVIGLTTSLLRLVKASPTLLAVVVVPSVLVVT